MRGFVAFLVLGSAVAVLIPFPELWPLAIGGFVIASLLSPRNDGGNLNGGRED